MRHEPRLGSYSHVSWCGCRRCERKHERTDLNWILSGLVAGLATALLIAAVKAWFRL